MNARIATLLLLSLAPSVTGAAEPDMDLDAFATKIAQFQKIRQEVGLPEHLLKPEAKRNGKEFTLNKYFEIFKTLRLKPGTRLDWVYSFSDLGGQPLLYIRDESQKPFQTSAELVEAVREEAKLDQIKTIWEDHSVGTKRLFDEFGDNPFTLDKEADAALEKLDKELIRRLNQYPRREYWHWWRESVIADGSSQSYLELAALFMLADQFALRWHSMFNDLEILPNRTAIQDRLGRHFRESEGKKEFIPDEVSAKALKLDPTPKVRFGDKTVEVSLLTFTKWGGFQRKTLVISKTSPHVVKSETDKTEVEWECGIMY